MFVEIDHRRTGIATELLRCLARWFTEQQARKICVNVEPDNAPARAFYARHGAVVLRDYWMVWNDIRTALHGM